jgi:hypothetical protein
MIRRGLCVLGVSLCVALVCGCASSPHASPDVLNKAFRASFVDLYRADATRFCADFTRSVADQLAIEIRRRFATRSGNDCETAVAGMLTLTGQSRGSQPADAGLPRNLAIREVLQHGRHAVGRVEYLPDRHLGSAPIRFELTGGRWRIAQVPHIEGAYFRSSSPSSSPVTESGVLSLYY